MSHANRPTGRMLTRLLTLALLLAVECVAGRAQTQSGTNDDEPDFIVPARPTVSNPAEFQRPGVLELDTDSPFSQKEGGARQTGAGDTQLGAQLVLRHEDARGPGVAVAYYLKLPTASESKGLGTGRFDHSVLALFSRKRGETTFDFNAVYLNAGRTTDAGRASSAQAALAASRDVTERFGLQGELSGMTRNDEQPGALFALGVATYKLSRRMELDCGVRFGLTHEAPRIGAVAGLTVGVARLFHRHATH
jgi:Putative MetA-pathway of phenol degradation